MVGASSGIVIPLVVGEQGRVGVLIMKKEETLSIVCGENELRKQAAHRNTGVRIGINSRASGSVLGPNQRSFNVDNVPLVSL